MPRIPHLRWLTISKEALRANLATVRKRLRPNTKVIAVVKANAYGHGMELVAKTVRTTPGLWGFAVANITEGLRLRAAGIRERILVLSYCEPERIEEGVAKRLSLVVYDRSTLAAVAHAARKRGVRARVHAKLDTGTHRIGALERDAASFLRAVQNSPHLKLEGVFSHFASSEEDARFTEEQMRRFRRLCETMKLPKSVLRHLACSAAVFRFPTAQYDAVRVGIALYGLAPWPAGTVRARLVPALSWRTRLVQVKSIAAGESVGYGRTFRARRPTRIGILPVGYADGYDRRFGNNAVVLVRGFACPVVGRISMNLATIDCSAVPSARAGDEVVLIGKQSRRAVTAADLAERAKTLHYEVVTRIHPDLPRLSR